MKLLWVRLNGSDILLIPKPNLSNHHLEAQQTPDCKHALKGVQWKRLVQTVVNFLQSDSVPLIPTIQRAVAHWRVFDSICKVSGQTVALVPFLDTISCFALTHQPIVQLPIDREAVLLVELNIYGFKKGAAVIPIASDSHRCAGNAVSWVCMLCNECMRRSWHRWDWLGIESTLVDKHRGIQRAINGALSIHICI